MENTKKIPVIDLFAGPGGLSEGFSAFAMGGEPRFDVRLSIEKDGTACSTLRLRKFFRSFSVPPLAYHEYTAGKCSEADLAAEFPKEWNAASDCTWQAELGKESDDRVAARVRSALGKRPGNWVLLGGPPCQAYSLVGRSRMKGSQHFEADERHFLYREYLRIVAQHCPAIFIMENVKGLLSSRHSGEKIIGRILRDLQAPGAALGIDSTKRLEYRLKGLDSSGDLFDGDSDARSFLLRAERYGIPQKRHRLIIVGVRSDIRISLRPLALTAEVPIDAVLAGMPLLRSRLSKEPDSFENWRCALAELRNQPWFSTTSFPNSVPVKRLIERYLCHENPPMCVGDNYLDCAPKPVYKPQWYRSGAKGLTLHESRSHMRTDLWRYLFASVYAEAIGRSPSIRDFPVELRPDHGNIADAVENGKFGDRFTVQIKGAASSTVTSHIAKDGHYYIHYDPLQCRSLTVREAARLQTFPDSYFFEGNRTEQFHQVGNAVPPLLARQIAEIIFQGINSERRG